MNLKPFLRLLPDWIYADPQYLDLDAGQLWVLHVMAGWAKNQHEVDDGSILVVCGEKALAKMRVAPSTFWRYVKEFDRRGFVRVIGRGGGKFANTLCIPGAKGAADGLRVDRRSSVRGRGGSSPIPPKLVCQKATRVLVSQLETGRVSNSDGTRVNLARPLVSQLETRTSEQTLFIPIHNGGSAADGGRSSAEQERRRELQLLGVNGATLVEMAADPALHPVVIRLLGVRAQEKRADNVPGWVIAQWRQGTHRKLSPLDPRDVSALARGGHLQSVAGHPVIGQVFQNASAAILRDADGREHRVPKAELVPAALVLVSGGSAPPHRLVS